MTLSPSARAGDAPHFRVKVRPSGDDALDPMISASSLLVSLQKAHYPGDFAFVARVHADYSNIATALSSRGYYDGQPIISIHLPDGTEVDGQDSHLLEHLRASGCQSGCDVNISVLKKDVYRIGTVQFRQSMPEETLPKAGTKASHQAESVTRERIQSPVVHLSPEALKALDLAPGAPADAGDVLAARDRLLQFLLETGHATARVETPEAYVDHAQKRLNVVIPIDPGPAVLLGPIAFDGQERTRLSFLRQRTNLKEGILYQPSRIEVARQELLQTGIFSYVGVNNAPPLVNANPVRHGLEREMPIRFSVREAKRHNISVQAGYSTDLGGRAGFDWTHRNVFGRAERLKLTALMTGIGGSAQQGIGYDFYADLLKPDVMRRDQNIDLRVEVIRQLLYSYQQTAFIARGGLVRKLGQRWNLSGSLSVEQEQIQQFRAVNNYFIASIPLTATYDSTGVGNPLAAATHGIRANMSITPFESFEGGNSFFTIMSATVSHYIDLSRFGVSKPGHSVLALRGVVGTVQGASTFQIPPDQRLYAGGPATVRGFRYQGIGPQQGKYGIGGTSLGAGTIELRQHLFGKFGMAAFVDAGQVSAKSRPFQGVFRVGYGAGARYDTPIGPVRLDFALPVNRPQNGDKWEFYVGLGETF